MIKNNIKMSEFTPVSEIDETTKVILIQGEPPFNAFISPDALAEGIISSEASIRLSSDLSLSTSIANEVSRAMSVEESISTVVEEGGSVLIEASIRLSSDLSLSSSISNETSGRISGDSSLLTLISSDYVPYTGGHSDVTLSHTIAVTGVKLNTVTPYVVQNPGDIGWNAAEGTFDMRLLNSTTLQVGQEMHFYGKAVGNISNGDVLQFAGVQGDHILLKKSVPSEIDAEPHLLVGIATQNIANGDFGYATWFGKVNDIYTTGWNTTQPILYYDFATGGLTNVKPSAPKRVIIIAAVLRLATGSAENGSIIVRPTFGTRLTDLDDVNGTALTEDGQIIVWDNTHKYFDFTKNINDYALNSALSTESSQRVSVDLSLSTELSTTTAIAKGAQQALSFNNYLEVTQHFNPTDLSGLYNIGQSIFVRTIDVPDIWISNGSYYASYSYSTDEQFIIDLQTGVHIGNYIFSKLETEKVDLTDYATLTDLSTETSQRISGDSSLSTEISTETSQRISSDSSLSVGLSNEISQRISSDLSLSTLISNSSVATERSQRISSDLSLSIMISQETSMRISSDIYVARGYSQSFVDADIITYTGTPPYTDPEGTLVFTRHDGTLYYIGVSQFQDRSAYNAVVLSADNRTLVFTSQDGSQDTVSLASIVPSGLSTETSQRISSDNSLSTGLSQRVSTDISLSTGLSTISTGLSTETSQRISSDVSLTTVISTGLSQRISSEDSLSILISTETSQRISSDNSLSTGLSQRVSTDISLSTGLSSALVNSTDSYSSTAVAKYVITLTAAEYAAIGSKDNNTLYIII